MYLRDKRSPAPKSEAVSRVMSPNRSNNSKPELLLRRALWHTGLRGYRLHHRIRLIPSTHHSSLITHNFFVRPDITFARKKLAIFVHGCFWHRWPLHCE